MLLVILRNVKEVGRSHAYVLNVHPSLTQTVYNVLTSSWNNVLRIADVKINFTGLVSLHMLLPIRHVYFGTSEVHFNRS